MMTRKSIEEEFQEAYAKALPSDGYATVQLSKRKVLVLKQDHCRGIANGIRTPARYDIVTTCKNRYVAETLIADLIKEETDKT